MPDAMNGDLRIHWTEQGSGTPVLLIMGALWSSRMWFRIADGLAPHHRVVMFDNRGIGQSGMPSDRYTVDDIATDALAVMDAAGIRSAHVYGVSLGGAIAQAVALRAPERVQSLVLGCTASHIFPRKGTRLRHLAMRLPMHVAIRIARKGLYGPLATKERIGEDLVVLKGEAYNPPGLLMQAGATDGFDVRGRLHEITAPTLIVHGDQDRAVELSLGEELAAGIQGARLKVLPGVGHSYITEVPELANELVLAFLRDVDQGILRPAAAASEHS
jgi:3-oxoadipate enol-lactonase